MHISYLLPIRTNQPTDDEFLAYVTWLVQRVELIVADGSDEPVFNAHANRWSSLPLQHVRVDSDLTSLLNGKVAGVLTAARRATGDSIVVADDDVRYDDVALDRIRAALERADVVRPQNYFDPLPWHAVLDTSRTLLNRISGGDWPGTIGIRRSMLIATGGYSGDVMFENLELVRTVKAAGGTEACPLDLYVLRRPPSTARFWSQRVRQAYDEHARPLRLIAWLAVLPAILLGTQRSVWVSVAASAVVIIAAEIGRRRAGGAQVFPFTASLAAPLWVCERAVCAWLAVVARFALGGIPYRGRIVSQAATPMRVLEHRVKLKGA